MITAAPQNHLTQENAICDPKHTPVYSKNDRPHTKKTPSLTPKAPITATKHQRILPQSYVRPQNTGYVRKTTATPAQNQTRVLSKHHHIINNLRLFPQKHTFSACITEKRNTEYSTEHKIQGKQTGIKRTDPYTTLIAYAPFPMRPRKTNAIPIYRTDMPNRNNKKTDFWRPLTGFQLKNCCKNTEFSPQHSNKPEFTPKKLQHYAAFSKTFLLLSPKSPAFSPQNRPSMKHCETNKIL